MNKLIMLYGFAASGKTTLTKKYIKESLLTIGIEGDEIIRMIGKWRKEETVARQLVFEHTKSIAAKHLEAGYDVIIPYLLNESGDAETFSEIALKNKAKFIEIYIKLEKEDAVNRLIERGCWGEEGSRQLTEADRDELENRFDYMTNVMKQRPKIISIKSEKDNVSSTYDFFINEIN